MVTTSRNLRTGRSIWAAPRTDGISDGPLLRDVKTGVLVIGAGITGALIGEALAGAGFNVVIVDRRGPAKGSTAASTALVQYEIDTPLFQLSRKIGKSRAIQAWRRSRLALDGLAGRLGDLAIHAVPRSTLFLEGDRLDGEGLRREQAARRAAGLTSLFLDRKEVQVRFGVPHRAGLVIHGGFVLDPRKATFGLLRSAVGRKARIFAPTDIVDLRISKTGIIAESREGPRVAARYAVFATGYELPQMVPRRGHKIISTWAIATRPQPRRLWPQQCMIWEAAEPYMYLRTTANGRVICGGEDEEFSDEPARDRLLGDKAQALSRKLKRLMPFLDAEAECAWTGSFGQSDTGLPTIGPVPGWPNCWAALGYGGNGITYAQIASDIISGALRGKPDVDAALYVFHRAGANR
jgi:glycine/D-amino acid oxidase-like deaminating enzyme